MKGRLFGRVLGLLTLFLLLTVDIRCGVGSDPEEPRPLSPEPKGVFWPKGLAFLEGI